jgi:signal transduction histidine kinase
MRSALLSTLLAVPDEERHGLALELVELARSAVLGDLAADVAHNVADPLFGVPGLVDLLLDGAPPGSDEEKRLQLLRQTALEMKGTLRALLDFARPAGDEPARADLADAVREALALVRHGAGRALEVAERYPPEPVLVACPPSLAAQAALHLLLDARRAGGPVTVEVVGAALRVAPAAEESLGLAAAGAIAASYGGALEHEAGTVTLRLLRESRAGSSGD